VQRRLSPPEVEALVAGYQAVGCVGELARAYGIHRTTVSAQVARAGKARRRFTA
jgi:DNA-binding MarR family transcriptional regulator